MTKEPLQVEIESLKKRISELEKACQNLESSIKEKNDLHARFTAITASTHEAIIMMDDNGVTDFWNKAAENIFGYKAEEVLGRLVSDFIIPQQYVDRHIAGVARFKETGTGKQFGQTLELSALRKNGEEFPIEISYYSSPIRLDGRWHAVAIIRDITKRKKAEEELRAAKNMAEQATKLKDQFVALVAHDLKSPFAAMMGLLKIYAEQKSSAQSEEGQIILERVFKSGDRMLNMIEQLLQISRLKTGKITPQPRFFRGCMAVAETLGSLVHNAAQKDIEIINEVPTGTRLYADQSLFDEVLANLLSNSIKFCSKGDKITIFTPPGLKSAIAVRDTGKGIDEKRLANIFRHEIATTTTGTAGEVGTGLGLPFSHDIMKAHGGELTVESAPGKGSVFCAMLPDVKPLALVVDNDLDILDEVRRHLEKIDVEVIEAFHGRKALAMLQEKRPHIIVSDIKMPVMDGFELLSQLKQDSATGGIPVILMTGNDRETREKAIRLGADDFVSKPIDVADFIPRVRKFVG